MNFFVKRLFPAFILLLSAVLIISLPGIAAASWDPFPAEVIMEHIEAETGNSFTITYNNRIFQVKYDANIISKEETIDTISKYYQGEEQMLDHICAQLQELSTPILERAANSIEINMDLTEERGSLVNYANIGSNKIYIYGIDGLDSLYHEMIHVLFGHCDIPWISEANAMYWPTFVDPVYFNDRALQKYIDMLTESEANYEEAMKAATPKEGLALTTEYKFVEAIKTIYVQKAPLPSAETFDYAWFVEATGLASIANHDLIPRIKGTNKLTTTVEQKKITADTISYDPNGMNYYEAMVFLKYLFENNDAGAIYKYYCGEKSFEEAFGQSYEESYESFRSCWGSDGIAR